jgi:hypothetical protein
MSRQNKQRNKAIIAQWVKKLHKEGKKVPRTKKLSSFVKGKCVIVKGIRTSLCSTKQNKEN